MHPSRPIRAARPKCRRTGKRRRRPPCNRPGAAERERDPAVGTSAGPAVHNRLQRCRRRRLRGSIGPSGTRAGPAGRAPTGRRPGCAQWPEDGRSGPRAPPRCLHRADPAAVASPPAL